MLSEVNILVKVACLKLDASSGRRFAIAKEIYINGVFHSMRKSVSDSILSILNFDFCAETIVKAVLIDCGVGIRRKSGAFKFYGELIKDLKTKYPNLKYIDEIDSLHSLRNDVQHNSNIPSEQEVSRHKTTVKLFFDEICQKAYKNSISYDDISLALFIKSEHEKIIIKEMEKAYQTGSLTDCVHYCKQAAMYHVMLLRSNMNVPPAFFDRFSLFGPPDPFSGMQRSIEVINNRLNWTIDRLCLREHYDDVEKLLGRLFNSPLISIWKEEELKRDKTTNKETEQARTLLYEFITSTQDLIKKPDLERPYVFDLSIKKQDSEGYLVQVGVLSASEISSAKITIKRDNIPMIESENIPKENGLHVIPIPPLEQKGEYQIHCEISTKNNEITYSNLRYILD